MVNGLILVQCSGETMLATGGWPWLCSCFAKAVALYEFALPPGLVREPCAICLASTLFILHAPLPVINGIMHDRIDFSTAPCF